MTLAKELYLLATLGVRYSLKVDVLRELPHFLHDLVFGAKELPKDDSKVYMDLHAHFHKSSSIRDIVDTASKRVDILSITERVGDQDHLTLKVAIEKLNQEGIEHTVLGDNVVRVEKEPSFYLLRSVEVYSEEGQGNVIARFNEQGFPNVKRPLTELMSRADDMGAVWFLDHPASIMARGIGFRYPTKQEIEQRRRWFEDEGPIIEVGNHQNTLYMFPSNILARRMAEESDLIGIANSSTHFNVAEVGLSRTGIPRDAFEDATESDVFGSLNAALLTREVTIDSGYSSAAAFYEFMIKLAIMPSR